MVMKWKAFRGWALEHYGLRLPLDSGESSVRYVVWKQPDSRRRAFTGTGNPADYGPIQQRRLAVWLRCRGLIDNSGPWLDAGESYDNGWLVNDGSGIRWLADPETEAHELVSKGFVAIKCGL